MRVGIIRSSTRPLSSVRSSVPSALAAGLLVLAGSVFCSCARAAPPQAAVAHPAAPSARATVSPGTNAGRALSTDVDATLIAARPSEAVQRIRDETRRAGGYVLEATLDGQASDPDARTTLAVRVPAERLEEFRALLGRVGELQSYRERVEDVTDQRVDLTARLQNARVQEHRILELFGSRTGGLDEAIRVESELARVRESIERMEAQDRALDGQIAMANVRLAIASPASNLGNAPIASIRTAARHGLDVCAAVLTGLAMLAATVGPTAITLGLGALLVAWAIRAARSLRTKWERTRSERC